MDNCKENEFFIMKNWNARGFVENIELVSGSYTGLAAALSTAHRQIDTAHFTATTHCTSLLCSVVTAVSDECQFKMSLFYPDRKFLHFERFHELLHHPNQGPHDVHDNVLEVRGDIMNMSG